MWGQSGTGHFYICEMLVFVGSSLDWERSQDTEVCVHCGAHSAVLWIRLQMTQLFFLSHNCSE